MLVRDLIRQLLECDPEAVVVYPGGPQVTWSVESQTATEGVWAVREADGTETARAAVLIK